MLSNLKLAEMSTLKYPVTDVLTTWYTLWLDTVKTLLDDCRMVSKQFDFGLKV